MTKVYVSSTYLDLQECREKVRLAVRRMGHEDVAMEYYVAGDERPVDKCSADVAKCDLYVGLFAWRYGYVPAENNPDKLSITDMEYRQAQKSGKTCLIFLLSEDASWPRKFMDKDATRIEQLRSELSAKHTCGTFTSAEDIVEVVAPAIHNWAREHGHIQPHMLIPELDLTAYVKALTKRYQHLDLDALTPPQKDEYLRRQLREVFVEQNVRENPPPVELPKEVWEKLQREKEVHAEDLPEGMMPDDVRRAHQSYYEKPPRPVLDALTDSHRRHSIILGDPGAGKSTLARYVLLSLISDSGDERLRRAFEGHLPLLIELRSYAGLCNEIKGTSFLDFIEFLGRNEGWGLTKDALENYLKTDGRAVVIFDGLDELFDPEDREQITRRIVGFALDHPKARVIVTSRVIGYRRKILADADFTHFTLQDLNEHQVATFVDRWYALALSDRPEEARARRERIMDSFGKSASIRQLAGNPMLLTIMAIIGKNQELPRERWKLYEHAASVLIQHWDVDKHLKDRELDAEFIGEEDKKELLRRLAFKMQAGAGGLAGNYIHGDQLQAEFEGYLKERYSQSPARAKVIAQAMIAQFRERNFILSLYGANLYGFVHRAFLEYFCATAFVHMFEKTQQLTLDQLKREVYGAHYEERSWHEVLRLICGIIDETKAGELIDFLTNEIPPPEEGYSAQRPPWNIALAVQCLSEVRNPGTIADPATSLLQAVCALLETEMASGKRYLIDFLEEHIAASAEVIGAAWPNRHILADWLTKLGSLQNAWLYDEAFGNLIGSVGAGIPEIHHAIMSYAVHNDPNRRMLAPLALAKGWHDESQTLMLLRDCAVDDANGDVRRAALQALGAHFRDDAETLPLLRDRAVSDETGLVRGTALRVVGAHFRDDAQTLPLLRERAVSDEHWYGRWIAVSTLFNHFRDDAQTLSIGRDRAMNDPHPTVRNLSKRLLTGLEQDTDAT